MFRSKTKKIKAFRDLQRSIIDNIDNKDDYSVGLYNGLEVAVAMLEKREPVFEACITKQPEIIEKEEEEQGRTIANGIRRR